jgi:hypothetical protein
VSQHQKRIIAARALRDRLSAEGRITDARIVDDHAMIEEDYGDRIMWGDGLLNDVVYGHVTGRMAKHPLDRMIVALNALERAPDLFRKTHVHAHDSACRERVVRCFQLIGTPRPLEPK